MKDYADIDSKFRFVILASMRAKELLKGAKPKIKSKSKNLIRIAQEEVEQGLIEFELIETPEEESNEEEKNLIVGEEVPPKPTLTLSIDVPAEPEVKPEKKTEKKVVKKKGKLELKIPIESKVTKKAKETKEAKKTKEAKEDKEAKEEKTKAAKSKK